LGAKNGVDTHPHAHKEEGFKHGMGYEVKKPQGLQSEGQRDGHNPQLRKCAQSHDLFEVYFAARTQPGYEKSDGPEGQQSFGAPRVKPQE